MKFSKIIKFIAIILFGLVMFFAGKITGEFNGKLQIIENLIDTCFALDYDKEQVLDKAAKCMVYALEDPYSEYMTKDEYEMYMEMMEGMYKGIGITISYDEERDVFFIDSVQADRPADIAGMEVGDVILGVDELIASNETYEELVYYIKGISEDSPDDDVEMKFFVERNGEKKEFLVKREEFKFDNLEYENIDGILYMQLKEFSGDAAKELEEALSSGENLKGIVLDLRDNGGGTLTVLEDIADLLLPSGVLLTTEDALGNTTDYRIEDDDYYDVPMAVLVNGETASASEVFSAYVKESGRGCLVGEQTYGKGLVQGIIPLGDGSGLRLTIEKYYTSKGNYINEIGIEPDIIEEDYDVQTEKAFNYVKNNIK